MTMLNKRICSSLALLLVLMVGFSACMTKKKLVTDFNLFQKGLDSLNLVNIKPVTIQPNDALEINFYTQGTADQGQTDLFNLLNKREGYLVSEEGDLLFPILGLINVKGITTKALSEILQNKIKPYIVAPIVLVRMKAVKVMVLGEVKRQGVIDLQPERSSIINLLAEVGGISEFGRKDSIIIIRNLDSNRKATYYVNLMSADVYMSPVYQLKQDDFIYVKANDTYLRQLYLQKKSTELQKLQPILLYTGLITTVLSVYLITRNTFFR